MRTVDINCQYHIGDYLLQQNYNIKLVKQEYPHLIINFWSPPEFREELDAHVPNHLKDRIVYKPYGGGDRPAGSVESWIGRDGWQTRRKETKWPYCMWDEQYIEFFDLLSRDLGVQNPIKTPYDFLFDTPTLLQPNVLTKHYDYLVLNSQPMSGQCSFFSAQAFKDLVKTLHDSGSTVVTTERTEVEDVPATRDYMLKLIDIGNLSTQVDNIIGVHTGTWHNTMNIFNIDKVKRRFVVNDHRVNFTHPSCIYADSFEMIYKTLGL